MWSHVAKQQFDTYMDEREYTTRVSCTTPCNEKKNINVLCAFFFRFFIQLEISRSFFILVFPWFLEREQLYFLSLSLSIFFSFLTRIKNFTIETISTSQLGYTLSIQCINQKCQYNIARCGQTALILWTQSPHGGFKWMVVRKSNIQR